jgi:LacI family transcriptional regulator
VPGRRKSVTVREVAAAAGVGISSVSRAFSNPGRINPATREHVLAIAAELGYRPNPVASALVSGRRATIGLVLPDITNPHFFGLVRGAQRQAATAGFTVVLGDSEHEPRTEEGLLERLGPMVDGFVMASSRLSNDRLRELAGHTPVALVNREVEGLSSVIVDHVDGTRNIGEHLASLGHRRIAFLAGAGRSWSGVRRWAALEAVAPALGMTARRLGPYPLSLAGGAVAADAALLAGVTAVVAHNDLLALGVLRRLAEREIRVPRDLSVVGYDDIFGADFSAPPLTTLAGPIQEAGRCAIDLVLELVADPNARRRPGVRRVLPSHLVIRGSTGPA